MRQVHTVEKLDCLGRVDIRLQRRRTGRIRRQRHQWSRATHHTLELRFTRRVHHQVVRSIHSLSELHQTLGSGPRAGDRHVVRQVYTVKELDCLGRVHIGIDRR